MCVGAQNERESPTEKQSDKDEEGKMRWYFVHIYLSSIHERALLTPSDFMLWNVCKTHRRCLPVLTRKAKHTMLSCNSNRIFKTAKCYYSVSLLICSVWSSAADWAVCIMYMCAVLCSASIHISFWHFWIIEVIYPRTMKSTQTFHLSFAAHLFACRHTYQRRTELRFVDVSKCVCVCVWECKNGTHGGEERCALEWPCLCTFVPFCVII